ncbi:MAG: U32 family peptidase C-terminal domain-containing protein, partial [Clostridia bacterium]|nr:U32 family peptidase C-terminal domain-containing protein [Clostridia bacterium]
ESEYLESSMPIQTHEFMAIVTKDSENGEVEIQQRNKFVVGDELEVLAPHKNFNKIIKVTGMKDLNGEEVVEAKIVQQTLILKTDLELKTGDILRKKIVE